MSERHFQQRVRVVLDGHIARISLTRSDKYNGLDFPMLLGLKEAGNFLKKQREVRVAILSGEGKAFCAGLDFPAVMSKPLNIAKGFIPTSSTNLFQNVCWVWRKLPFPVIAVTHGYCYGGGLQIALGCDFRISTPDCDFSVMEIKWGLIPDMSASVTLRELVPLDVAKELTLTGRTFKGEEAKALGLVTRISEQPQQEAEQLAAALAARSPTAVAAAKKLLHRTRNSSVWYAFFQERWLQLWLLLGFNRGEAAKANREKREPRFKSR